MVCTNCNTPAPNGVNFCPRCGTQMVGLPQASFHAADSNPSGLPPAYANAPPQPAYAAGPPMYANPYMPRPRVARNVQTLGILWFVYAAYRTLGALTGIFFLRFFTHRNTGDNTWPFHYNFMNGFVGSGAPSWVAALIPIIAAATFVSVALSLFVGWSLINRKPWGRVLAIIAAVLALIKLPFGTGLGIYTLWVLAPRASGLEYDAIADRS